MAIFNSYVKLLQRVYLGVNYPTSPRHWNCSTGKVAEPSLGSSSAADAKICRAKPEDGGYEKHDEPQKEGKVPLKSLKDTESWSHVD